MILKERKQYIFNIMVITDHFLYVISICISTWVVTLRFELFSGWHKMSILRNGLFVVTCDVCMKLAWKFHFLNNTGMSQVIYICMLQIATFLLHSYYTLLLLTVCHNFVCQYPIISWNTTSTATVIFCQNSKVPWTHFLSLTLAELITIICMCVSELFVRHLLDSCLYI